MFVSLWLRGFLLAGALCILPVSVFAQHALRVMVLDAHEGQPISGVNVVLTGTTLGAATDEQGTADITGIPSGSQTFEFSIIGFQSQRHTFTFPLPDPDQPRVIRMEEEHEELEEVSISAMRTSRTIADIPTRVETIAGEEIDEKISMDPSGISMLLNESPGITVQQTSATSGNAAIRIQGLDGRYTQLLKDGFPLYGGFSGGLSILQVPPLDLERVEVIKGPSSTLYGGDAIAGLINLVSKAPVEDAELSLLANLTSAGGVDAGGFYRARGVRTGVTLLATGNLQRVYDADKDQFSNLPETGRLTLHPTFYYYPGERTIVSFGVSGTFERREGGDISAVKNQPSDEHPFFERNHSNRITSQVHLDHNFAESILLTVKNSVSIFDRSIEVPGYRFEGRQTATYSEVSSLFNLARHDFVAGVDVRTDAFTEDGGDTDGLRNYAYASTGVFVQDTWDLDERLVLETGVRTDFHSDFGTFVLPKVSLLVRFSDQWSARLGGGLGYKAPTVFLEPSEERAFLGVRPLSGDVKAETSRGGSIDVNYETFLFDRLGVALNQAVYLTRLNHPLLPDKTMLAEGVLSYQNANGFVQSLALETNLKLTLDDFKLFFGYVYLDTYIRRGDTNTQMPLIPEHKTYTVLVYEKHGTGRIGVEAYYTGSQRLSPGSNTDGYWIAGIMGERRLGPVRLFLNFENVLDTKQNDYAPVVLGPPTNPQFAEIWAPMDGFMINGGVKIDL